MVAQVTSLRLKDVTFGFDGSAPVFDGLDFEIPAAPLVWVKGSPGMGKSSLLKIFAGLLTPQRGSYFINDVDVLELSFKEYLPYRLAMGYSFDTGGLLTNRSLYENLMLPLRFHRRCSEAEAEARVKFWMDKFNIAQVKDSRPFSVTGSQRKSTVLLRAFIHFPQIVFLDDATSGLKEDGRRAFGNLVEECIKRHGLKHVIFCAERELPVQGVPTRILDLSNGKNSAEEAAS